METTKVSCSVVRIRMDLGKNNKEKSDRSRANW